jgi:hypothetical protein
MRRCPENQAVHMDYHVSMPQRLHTSKSPNMICSSTERTLGFIDKTELKNNETCCLSKKLLLTCSEERNYTNNGQQKAQQDVRFIKQRGQRHHGDVVHKSHSYTNTVTGVEDDKSHCLPNETSVSHQMDEEQGMGDMPAIRQAWHSRRHKGAFLNYQTNMALPQVQPSIKLDGPGNGETRHRHGDVIHGGQPNMNNKHMERLMNVSGRAIAISKKGRNDVYTSYRGHEKLTEEKVSK